MKKILVPIDFSDYSANAFRMAGYMARVKGMSIKLLHVFEERNSTLSKLPFFSKKNHEYTPEMERHISEHLQRMVALEQFNGLTIEQEVRRSNKGVTKEILNEDCDVIIMGRRREENEEVFFTGSIAEKVVRLSPIPVITVGALRENFSIQNIVFASDFEEPEQAPIIQRVLDLANIFNAQLHFLYVSINREFLSEKKSQQTVEYLAGKFDLQNHNVEIYFADTEEAGISGYIQQNQIDLLALCTHGRSGIASFFIGSVAENMSAYASVPVVTYNISKKKIERAARPITREKISLRKKTAKHREKGNNL